jgi:hypothetical protein
MGQIETLVKCISNNNLRWVCQVDIGIWMSRTVLAHKLELRTSRNPNATWNLRNWPAGYVEGEENRLFVACEGKWIGYFKLAQGMLWNRFDTVVPYTLIFATRTWTPIQHVPVPRFRGFTYKVPAAAEPTATS